MRRLIALAICSMGLGALPILCNAQETLGVELSKAGLLTKALHAYGFLFLPKSLDRVHGVYAYPATASQGCQGENLDANGLGAVINGSKGRLWGELSQAEVKRGSDGLCIHVTDGTQGEREVLSSKLLRDVNPSSLYFVDLTNNTFYKSRASVTTRRANQQQD